MRYVKALEIVLMLLAAMGFLMESLSLLLVTLFLMGLQSTLFGPAKYSVLPELLSASDLLGGNALVEMGTFVAILLGTVAGGVLIGWQPWGPAAVSVAVVVVAIAGWLASRHLPPTHGVDPTLTININPVIPLKQTLRATRVTRGVFIAILAISWFWFIGATMLTVLPAYAKDHLHGNEGVVTFLLAEFCVGIAIGSVLCGKLSGERLELRIVPIGAIGLSIAALDLFFVGSPTAAFPSTVAVSSAAALGSRELIEVSAFLSQPISWRICFDFVLLAVCGGLYTVPLYTLIQQRAPTAVRSRVIAGNNILNALFMVASAAMLAGCAALGLTIPQIFLVLALSNGVVAMLVHIALPELMQRPSN